MKKVLFMFAAFCAGVFMVSCGSNKNMLTLASLNGEWNIVEVDGQKTSMEEKPFIGFEVAEKRIYGNSGCNRMMGSFEADSLKPGLLSFGQIGSTRMMCPDMKIEDMILGALNKVKSYQTVSDSPEVIALCADNGEKLMLLEKKIEAPSALASLSGEWTIESVNGKKAVGNADIVPFLGFNLDESRIYGNIGCNTVNGGMAQEEGQPASLRFEQVAATMMMCPDMETETNVLNALNETRAFNVVGDGTVSLLDANGNELLILKKK